MTESPYEILGVEKDATPKEIARAAKEHAKKNHPDTGGDADEFVRGRKALIVLSDPKRRAEFDRTGKVTDEPHPDHDINGAMGVIHSQIAAATNQFLLNGFKAEHDPRKFDLLDVVRGAIMTDIAKGEQTLADGRSHMAFMRDFAKRFKARKKARGKRAKMTATALPFDFITRQVEDEIKEIERKIEGVENAIRISGIALDLLEFYDFEFTPPEPVQPVYYPGGTFTGFVGGTTRLY